jgi:hypothetical protein
MSVPANATQVHLQCSQNAGHVRHIHTHIHTRTYIHAHTLVSARRGLHETVRRGENCSITIIKRAIISTIVQRIYLTIHRAVEALAIADEVNSS